MSLETVSDKRNRVYPRAFDHEEARRLRALDPKHWTYARLADHFGVSAASVERILDPERKKRMDVASNRWARNHRKPCRGGCGKLVWMHGRQERSGYCQSCRARREVEQHVRDDTIRCLKCEQWKPDEEFPRARASRRAGQSALVRRGRDKWCRACATAARRDYRKAHPEKESQYTRDYRARKRMEGDAVPEHIVLKQNGTGWVEIGRVEAVRPAVAIEALVTEPGEYIAVTAARFRPMKVEPVRALKVVNEKEPA